MNRKGQGGIGAIMLYTMLGIFTSMAVAAGVLKDSHRERKAIEKCEAEQSITECDSAVASMSKEEVLAYIKDDDMSKGNRGFAVNNK